MKKQNWWKSMVRRWTAWAWAHEAGVCEGLARIKEMSVNRAAMKLAIETEPELSQYVAHCFANLVAESPNYTEMKFDMVAKSDNWEWVTVTVLKAGGKTPHEFRQELELKVRELELKVRLLEAEKQ